MVGAPGASLAYLHLVNDLRGKEGLRCIFSVCKAQLNIHVWVNAGWQCAKLGRSRRTARRNWRRIADSPWCSKPSCEADDVDLLHSHGTSNDPWSHHNIILHMYESHTCHAKDFPLTFILFESLFRYFLLSFIMWFITSHYKNSDDIVYIYLYQYFFI